MKKFMLLFILTSLISITYSQNIINVTPGDGTLKQAIQSAQTNDIIKLVPGGLYTESTDAYFTITKPITIEVDGDSKSVKPIIKIQKPVNSSYPNSYFVLSNNSGITVKGIEFDGIYNNAVVITDFARFNVGSTPQPINVKNIKIIDCYIHHTLKDVINGQDYSYKSNVTIDTIVIENSIIHNVANGGVVHLKTAVAKYVELKNSTIYKLAPYGVRILGYTNTGQHISAYLKVDHITMDNGLTGIKNFITMEEVEGDGGCLITNSIFSNLNESPEGSQKGLYWKNEGPGLYDSVALISNVCLWKIGKRDFRLNMFKDTVTMNPNYKDAANGDFTLPDNSPLQTMSTTKGPIGDPRWGKLTNGIKKINEIPSVFYLEQNYPNPFNPTTNIRFTLPKSDYVSLVIYNLVGKEITRLVDGRLNAGTYLYEFNSKGLSSGVYFYRLSTSSGSIIKKMTLIK
ncbi:MAG TPA: DUF5123 domain-containing protein [Ignavibacteria bacterium]